MKKRGQLTVFIVIGIFLLAFIGVLLYFRQERAVQEVPEIVPENLMPVKRYIEECMQRSVEEAAVLLGIQGGYIYLPERIAFDPTSYILVGGVKTPYWYYQGRSRMPTIDSMQDEIDRYILENIDRCLLGFGSFAESFDIIPEGNRTVNTTIEDDRISVKMTYPLSIQVKGEPGTNSITRFSADVSIKLKKAFSLAREIMSAENSQMFLEKATIDLMAAGKDIPFTDVLFECGQRQWFKPDIENKIKNLIYYNFPKIRIRGTNYVPFIAHYSKYELLKGYTPEDIAEGRKPKAEDVPEDSYDYFHLLWDATINDYSDMRAYVNYQKDWDFKLVVRPSKGSMMKSSWGKGSPQYYMSFLCINAYHFTYDVIYPVEIVIKDDSALNGRGYTFRYATPVLINHNEGDRSNFPITAYDYPDGRGGAYCDDRYDHDTVIYAKNKKTFEDIPNVEITFNCMNIYTCDLGKTGFQYGTNRLTASLPSFCQPPTIEATHDSYAKVTKTISSDATYTDIIMTPLKTMGFEIVKQRLAGGEMSPPGQLEPGETAVLYLTTDKLQEYDMFRKYPFDEDTPADFRKIKLPDDDLTYRLEIILLNKDNRIIGGFRGNWTVDDADIAGKSRITFNAIEKIPHPVSTEEQADMVLMLEAGLYNSKAMPKFS